MDDWKRLFMPAGLVALFACQGCSTAPFSDPSPAIANPFAAQDPWTALREVDPSRDVFRDDPFLPLVKAEPNDLFAQDVPSPPYAAKRDEAALPQAAEKTTGGIGTEELEEKLSGDYWLKNLELERWIENGMRDPNPKRDPDRLRRLAETGRLNMSQQERKKNRNMFEYSVGLLSTWRWYHKEIEQLGRIATEDRPDPMLFFEDPKYRDKKHAPLLANAAILMGRDGDPAAEPFLLHALADTRLRVELRCAAAETLGKLYPVSPETLVPLLEPVKEREIRDVNRHTNLPENRYEKGIALLWIELLVALAEKVEPWSHPCFLEPLSARNGMVRLEAAKLWRRASAAKRPPASARLSEEFLAHVRSETDLPVRVELIKILGLWGEPDILDLVRTDLNRAPLVCNAAIAALAEAGCQEAVSLIRDKARGSVPENRAEAIRALCRLGDLDEVVRYSEDKSWKVRVEVARVFADRRTPPMVKLARSYLNDNEKVRLATLDALADWPIDESGSLLLETLKSNVPSARHRARDILARHFPEASRYDTDADPKSMKDRHTELAGFVRDSIRSEPSGMNRAGTPRSPDRAEAVPDELVLEEIRRCLEDWMRPDRSPRDKESISKRLIQLEDRLLPCLDYLYVSENRAIPDSLDAVLAQTDPLFETIVRLDADRVAERRLAASEFVRWSRNRDLPRLACRRVLERTMYEEDPIVLGALLDGFQACDGVSARRLALSLLDSENNALRLRACRTLKEFGDDRDLDVLMELLHDTNRSVVRGALEAIVARMDELEETAFQEKRPAVSKQLRSGLLRVDPALQVDFGAALHFLGDPVGRETLFRLSLASDTKVRIHVARTVAVSEDQAFVPILIRFLEDNGTLRQIALEGLPKLAGEDIDHSGEAMPEPSGSTREQILYWKNRFVRSRAPRETE